MNMRDSRPTLSKLDVVGTGFTVLDRVYADGALEDEALGGSCANVLVSLAMLHRNVAPVIRLGADAEGERLVNEFSKAGAVVDFIYRYADLRSPVLREIIDRSTAEHSFSFRCPETDQDFPRYVPIDAHERALAQSAFASCTVFYTDRLSSDILDAMKLAAQSGAVVVFEPSEIMDPNLFREAMSTVTVLKMSADRLDREGAGRAAMDHSIVMIVTHGETGLEIRDWFGSTWCAAISAPDLRDACGSGDMVTVGLIDWILTDATNQESIRTADIINGVVAGQRLAAANCGFDGARGLFRCRGAQFARSILDGVEGVSAHGNTSLRQQPTVAACTQPKFGAKFHQHDT